jgi:hypothetical protein
MASASSGRAGRSGYVTGHATGHSVRVKGLILIGRFAPGALYSWGALLMGRFAYRAFYLLDVTLTRRLGVTSRARLPGRF